VIRSPYVGADRQSVTPVAILRRSAQGALVPDRRRGGRLRREWARRVRAATAQALGQARVPVRLRPAGARRRGPPALETRKATLSSLLRGCLPGLRINEHLPYPGDMVFRRVCKMGLEGIVSKRLGSRYVSGRTRDWLKMKNPDAPAVKREAEEDWGRGRRPRREAAQAAGSSGTG
jgi:hypothetical protein